MKKPRILIVTPLLPPESGGPAYYAVGLEEAFTQAGYEVKMLAFREVRRYPSGIRHLVFLYKALFALMRADVCVVLDTVSVALPAVLAGWFLKKRVIIRTGGDFVWERYVERTKEKVLLSEFYEVPRRLSWKERALVWVQKNIIFRCADYVVFSTAWQRDIWRTPYGIAECKVRVVENVCIRREKREEKVPNDGKKFLCVGRNLFLKNIPMVHEIFAKLSQEGVGAEVVVLQNVPREEVFAVLAHARALIIPSFSEVSPNLALEALACGTPVILTQDCGMKERLADAVLWIDSRDPLSLERAVRACCDEREYSFLKEKVESFSFSRTYVDVARDFEEMLQDKK